MEIGFVEQLFGNADGCGHICASKVGGKPVWPDLSILPEGHACKKCGKPTVMLLQIHAPLTPEDQEDKRALFLFMCTDPQCHSAGDARCFQVFRYERADRPAADPDLHLDASAAAVPGMSRLAVSCAVDVESPDCSESNDCPKEAESVTSTLCAVCGVFGIKRCGNCRSVSYCCRDHQIHDWKAGHKRDCSDATPNPVGIATLYSSLGVVLPEWDVVTELESLEEGEGEGEERSEEERMKDYERYMDKVKGEGKPELSAAALEAAVGGGVMKEDKMFRAFMERIAKERGQVSAMSCTTYHVIMVM